MGPGEMSNEQLRATERRLQASRQNSVEDIGPGGRGVRESTKGGAQGGALRGRGGRESISPASSLGRGSWRDELQRRLRRNDWLECSILTPAFNFSPLHTYHFEVPLGIYDNEDLRAEARFWVRTNVLAKAKRPKGASTRGRNRNRRRRQLKRCGAWACGVKGDSKATSHRQLTFFTPH